MIKKQVYIGIFLEGYFLDKDILINSWFLYFKHSETANKSALKSWKLYRKENKL
jgi:hypothetical protein